MLRADQSDANEKGIQVKVSLEKVNDAYRLKFKLKNTSGKVLGFYLSDLPWATPGSVDVILLDPEHHTPLKDALAIYNPDAQQSVLAVNQELEGNVSLSERFPALNKLLLDRDIVVFWTYQMNLLDGQSLNRTGGWLLIPRYKK